ncbi:MAG: HAMP domain-containing histidine kinase [Phycisphaerae bacterium]|nr:HAMP domain-containing histidine kinase [Phycisphaerae bacterium]
MWGRISLETKCLVLFGAASVLILAAAFAVVWVRGNAVTESAQREVSRNFVLGFEAGWAAHPGSGDTRPESLESGGEGPAIRRLTLAGSDLLAVTDAFIGRALRQFRSDTARSEWHEGSWQGLARRYRFSRAERGAEGALVGMVLLDRVSASAGYDLLIRTVYASLAGLFSAATSVALFYLITTRIILGPVRSLKHTAEQAREGNLDARSDVRTGDEFQELAETFNEMLSGLQTTQNQLRALNSQLDLKVDELSQRNMALYESNKLKGEFLASVSHELRTPLNSIIGFAELLQEAADKEAAAGDDSSRLSKRRRFTENILSSARSLLDMITGLLELAKAEAGKLDLRPEPVNLRDTCEALLALMRPVADKRSVTLTLEASADLPVIHTDAKKLHQIIFNLLSNAVKFSGDESMNPEGAAARGARVTLRAERLPSRKEDGSPDQDRVRVSVLDSGPGIAAEDQQRIFEKFVQLDSGHERRHSGTGLGLAIVKELSHLLQGEIHVESELGRGSMFSIILPLAMDPTRQREIKLEMAFRGSLSGRS